MAGVPFETIDIDSAEVARRFARHRPGYALVSYREVALPLFLCELSAKVTELKPIAPVQEFVLRVIATGLRRHDEIAPGCSAWTTTLRGPRLFNSCPAMSPWPRTAPAQAKGIALRSL